MHLEEIWGLVALQNLSESLGTILVVQHSVEFAIVGGDLVMVVRNAFAVKIDKV